ncbi:N-acetyl-gamma-glutamyl-phosphate reductase [Methanoregula boonei 6A8]|jgi:N-acetyl-gamma-glutamyl-phosphate reductase|uniref:N-acetyl-gamma-glutamyl-phosphate reductase n=1 Tax=Methanoregula boonei (strain DSM 21154 / JCM 14090 / 6A8) TaxID=456442 RepID=ARGC_METB6|nr:N-acetyl-gamma-glutamyl-phosphate reductase [Methanoregula boonei]A7I4D1.1 RecName: Full=N-acetyl-gamma-glutamyl-phosphate reductase; Short=AGPR; AltName: Full=N-acetyl-glutamate semialdehyde dehydrogenase; Short=NAGSA dehydrogenase [Methanoregula boonei 6A8]ABS54592.1 N-acetyl-gamma-glutamyl-phosphate reductase [Methanoregula boonei 6A8]
MKVAIVGASGYAGGELVRLLYHHSSAEVTCVTSRSLAGIPLSEVHPQLTGFSDLRFENPAPDAIDADVAFLAVPHTAAMTIAGKLLSRGIKVVDLSADYRLPKDTFEKVYGVTHTDYFPAPYGIPELHRKECINAKFVANPGCFPTGATLAAAPIASRAHTIIFDSKTGVSGAGDNPSATTHYPNVGDNVSPYKWTSHRHLAEMKQELSKLGSKAACYFTPHLVPVNRGILTTAHILLNEPLETKEVEKLYREYYKDEFFVRYQKPMLSAVRGSNFCDIMVESEGKRVVVVSAIDNLVKGASGQAIQNMNLMCGFKETDGLDAPGLLP